MNINHITLNTNVECTQNSTISLFNTLPSDIKKIIFKLAGIESWRSLVQLDKTNHSFFLKNFEFKADFLAYKSIKKCESDLPDDEEAKSRVKIDLIELLSSLNPSEVKIEEIDPAKTPEEKLLSIVDKLAHYDLEKALALTKSIRNPSNSCKALIKIAKTLENSNSVTALDLYKNASTVIMATDTLDYTEREILLTIVQSIYKQDFPFCLSILKTVKNDEHFSVRDKIAGEISKGINKENLESLLEVVKLMPEELKCKSLIAIAKNLILIDQKKASEIFDAAIEITVNSDTYYTNLYEIALIIRNSNPVKALELLNQALGKIKNSVNKQLRAADTFSSLIIHQLQNFENICFSLILRIDEEKGKNLLKNITDQFQQARAYYACAFALAQDDPDLSLELISSVDTKHFDVHRRIASNLPLSEISRIKSLIESIKDSKERGIALDYVLERINGKDLLSFLDIVLATEDPFEKTTFLAAFSKAVDAFVRKKAAELADEAIKLAVEYKELQTFEVYAFLAQKLVNIDLISSLTLGRKCIDIAAAEPMPSGTKLSELYLLFNELLVVDTLSALSFMYDIITQLKPFEHNYFEVLGTDTAMINPKIAFDLIMRTRSTYGKCVGLTNFATTILNNPNHEKFKDFWV